MTTEKQRPLTQVIRGLMNVPDLNSYRSVKLDDDLVLMLRSAEASVRRLRRQVEDRLVGSTRPCDRCGKPVTGRPDRKYCSGRCRQSAYQERRKPA